MALQQIKKKLEDVLRKLDHLYTQLHRGKVSFFFNCYLHGCANIDNFFFLVLTRY